MAVQPPYGTRITADNLTSGNELFTHLDPILKVERTFSIPHVMEAARLAVAAGDIKLTRIRLEPAWAKFAKKARGIEMHRLSRIKEADFLRPLLYFEMPPDHLSPVTTHLLVDGHHRYVRAVSKFKRTLPGYLLPPDWWAPTEVFGIPPMGEEMIREMYSGIK